MMYRMILLSLSMLIPTAVLHAATFQEDVDFLKQHVEVILLKSTDGMAQVAVVPEYQGRVMTSTASGPDGPSFGWINRELIASGEIKKHINVFGGEDRFWMGPEGGQFSIFFSKDAPFDLEHWQTPAFIDTVPYKVVSKSDTEVTFEHTETVTNYSGATFEVKISRTIRLKPADPKNPETKMVDFESVNTITNAGQNAWTKETGLLSVWILGMFNPSPETTIVIPFIAGDEGQLDPKVNDAYFGKVPAEKLVVRDDVLFFSGDGTCRSKIGISPKRAKEWLGSYDAAVKALTLVQYTLPKGVTDYVNSMWELQEHPFAGDTVNSYNDGSPEPGKKPLGPFYELETSSPAAQLEPGKSLTHTHRTQHILADTKVLDKKAKRFLGVGLDEITSALSQ